jgi:hypothetical protein
MRNILDNICTQNQTANFIFNNFFSENRATYEIMRKNMGEPQTPQMTVEYGACALLAGQETLLKRTHIHKPTLAGTHTPTHARTHTHTHTRLRTHRIMKSAAQVPSSYAQP